MTMTNGRYLSVGGISELVSTFFTILQLVLFWIFVVDFKQGEADTLYSHDIYFHRER
jgi:hypothetical protein